MSEKYVSRLRKLYEEEIKSDLKSELAIENINAIPKIEKISINMGVGEAIQNKKIL